MQMSYYMNNGGGWNKSHDQVEKTPRMDSFDLANDCCGLICIGSERGETALLDFAVSYIDADKELVEFWHKGNRLRETLIITHLQNGYGISGQTFWRCPRCGKRVRYIYLSDKRFRCRSCARLNYKRSQDNIDSTYWYRLGMDYAREHFGPPPFEVDGFTFCEWTPERPRYMHQTTYQKHLVRFRRYQLHHAERIAAELAWMAGLLAKYGFSP